MKYFLFINHPKGELDEISAEKEEQIKRYFSGIDTIEDKVVLEGKEYNAVIDYGVFANLTNFDCFNCLEHCCGDAPAIFNDKIRNYILKNKTEFNNLTKVFDIYDELGYSEEEQEKIILEENVLVPEEHLGDEIDLCACAYSPKNGQTLCSLHSICLGKNGTPKEIIANKPLICSLWPLEIFLDEGINTLYITLPDDFTNNFSIENYYTKSCINIDFAMSPIFKRENPEGFLEEEFKPFIVTYAETLKVILGNKIYEKIKKRLISEGEIEKSSFDLKTEQINKIL